MKTKRISTKFELKDCKELDHSECGHPDVYAAATHTPTPWTKESSLFRTPATVGILADDSKKIVVQWQGVTKQELDQVHADAAFIVRAVNAHEDLLAAVSYVSHLSEFREGGKYAGAGTAFREIIAKAEAK